MRTFFLFLTILTANIAFSQTGNLKAQPGSLKGVIRTSDGNPAESVTITLKGTSIATSSDARGNYEIKKLRPGLYTLVVSFTGLVTKEERVEIAAGVITTAPEIRLNEDTRQLNEVVVSAGRTRAGDMVAKTPLKYMENPQVYASVSGEIMKQQIVSNYDDALKNVPGLTRTWESTGRPGDGTAYFALRGFEAQPSLVNGLPGLTSGNLDPADVEEIQVIKGPSGTLFGASFYGYGGIINTITKKPYSNFGGEVGYNVGSFGLNRATADVNAPLSKNTALRLNAAWQSENSFQDAGFKRSFFIAPSFMAKLGEKLTINVLAEALQEKRAVAPIFFNSDRFSPLLYKNLKELNLNNKLSFTSNDLTIKNPRVNLQAQAVYRINSQWTSQTVFSAGNTKSKGIYSYIWDDMAGDEYYNQYFHDEDNSTTTFDVQENINGDVKIGSLRNRFLIGLDFFTRTVKDNGSGWVMGRYVTPQSAEVAFTDANTGDEFPAVRLTGGYVKGLIDATTRTPSKVRNSAYSAYASDVINITPDFTAMVAVRADYFRTKRQNNDPSEDYDQWSVSPKFGLAYQVVPDKLSFFANYMNAFFNVAPSLFYIGDSSTGRYQIFKPEHANQFEGGVKLSLLQNKINATLSYYDIRVGNRVYPDPANPNNSRQGGKTGSNGFELEVHANPVPGFNLLAGVSHTNMRMLEGNKDDFYNEPGRAPGGQGPADLANLWTTYQFQKGSVLRNFGLGGGVNHAGVYKVIDNSATGVFELPSYTLVNGSVFYNASKFRIAFNVNNITDKSYYIGYWSVNPQKPRNFAASVTFRF